MSRAEGCTCPAEPGRRKTGDDKWPYTSLSSRLFRMEPQIDAKNDGIHQGAKSYVRQKLNARKERHRAGSKSLVTDAQSHTLHEAVESIGKRRGHWNTRVLEDMAPKRGGERRNWARDQERVRDRKVQAAVQRRREGAWIGMGWMINSGGKLSIARTRNQDTLGEGKKASRASTWGEPTTSSTRTVVGYFGGGNVFTGKGRKISG